MYLHVTFLEKPHKLPSITATAAPSPGNIEREIAGAGNFAHNFGVQPLLTDPSFPSLPMTMIRFSPTQRPVPIIATTGHPSMSLSITVNALQHKFINSNLMER